VRSRIADWQFSDGTQFGASVFAAFLTLCDASGSNLGTIEHCMARGRLTTETKETRFQDIGKARFPDIPIALFRDVPHRWIIRAG
jgi:hypothetical protein